MLRNLILIITLSLLSISCISNYTKRSVASSSFNLIEEEKIHFSGFTNYFPLDQPNSNNGTTQLITLNNKYDVAIKYRIVSLGNIVLIRNRGECEVSGQDSNYAELEARSSCSFYIGKDSLSEATEGEIRVYKKDDNDEMLIDSESIYSNTLNQVQCSALVKNAYIALNPDDIDKKLLDKVGNQYTPKQTFIDDCQMMDKLDINSHHKTHLLDYCISDFDKAKKNPYITQDGLNLMAYREHLNKLSAFDPDSYCQDIE